MIYKAPKLPIVYSFRNEHSATILRSDTVSRWEREAQLRRAMKAHQPEPKKVRKRKRRNSRIRRRNRYWARLNWGRVASIWA